MGAIKTTLGLAAIITALAAGAAVPAAQGYIGPHNLPGIGSLDDLVGSEPEVGVSANDVRLDGRGVFIEIACASNAGGLCSGALDLVDRNGSRVGSGGFSVDANQAEAVYVALPAKLVRRAASGKQVRLLAEASATDGAGRTATDSAIVTVRR